MAPRILRLTLLGRQLRRRQRQPPTSRWFSSGISGCEQTRFSYFAPANQKVSYFLYNKRRSEGSVAKTDFQDLIVKLGQAKWLDNSNGHNAATLLATPHFAKAVEDSDLVGEISRCLAGSAKARPFHVLCAIVDHVPPARGETGAMQGISVLRGHLDDTLPEPWPSSQSQNDRQSEALASLSFDLGSSSITLPLARTIFDNSRPSTLTMSRYDFEIDSPRLVDKVSKMFQTVRLSPKEEPQTLRDLELWAPLSPLTWPRVVTDSFGNIIRGVEIDGTTHPASSELESAVESIFQNMPASETPTGPVGIWAMITANELSNHDGPLDPTPILQGKTLTRQLIEADAKIICNYFRARGRLYQVLSGGGGWGAKKGLLSLDPQRTHMPLSDEEEMARFMQAFDPNSGFAPAGSRVQFFATPRASPKDTALTTTGTIFGVPSRAHDAPEAEVFQGGYLKKDHFGALSKAGIFMSGPSESGEEHPDERKLSVPGSGILVQRSKEVTS
ncbi:hypothetical protein HIM_06930 [Hirsutella minnesotensis 3608]|uniref:FIST domain-containing protein n=1 Tax=Hirsutella minnesotensis 3608 TaxID=1043627 RepID=A0A0F7ZZ48_9HYPO|nr:hypothetical protein HIM_06930 [Hirsutella minnesotensis 3608]